MDKPNLDESDFDEFDFETSEFDDSDFETTSTEARGAQNVELENSRIETYLADESLDHGGDFDESNIGVFGSFGATEEAARVAELTTPLKSKRGKQAESVPKEQRGRKKSGSFIKTMDALVISSAIVLLGLWLLGHGVLWLIGGSSGWPSMAHNASAASVNPAVAHIEAEYVSSADQDSQINLETEDPSLETEAGVTNVNNAADNATTDTPKNQDRNTEFTQTPATPAETSFRPTYTGPEPTKKQQELTSPAQGRTLGGSWELEQHVDSNSLVPEEASPVAQTKEAEPDGSTEFQFGSKPREPVNEPEIQFGSEIGPIDTLEIPVETSVTQNEAETEVVAQRPVNKPRQATEDLFKTPKTYPMRVWTSARGSKANLALVSVDGGNIIVVDEKGKRFSLPFARFSEADQEYVRDAIRH